MVNPSKRKGKEKIREEEIPTTTTETQNPPPSVEQNATETQLLVQQFEQFALNRNLHLEVLNSMEYMQYNESLSVPSNNDSNNGGEGSSKGKGKVDNNNNNSEDFAQQCVIKPANITPESLQNIEEVIEENDLDEKSAEDLRRIAALQGLAEAAGAIRQVVGLSIKRSQKINERLKEIIKEFNKVVGNNGKKLFTAAIFGSTVISVFIYSLRTGNLPVRTGQAIAAVLARGGQQVVSESPNILNNQVLQTGLLGGFIGFLLRNARYFRR